MMKPSTKREERDAAEFFILGLDKDPDRTRAAVRARLAAGTPPARALADAAVKHKHELAVLVMLEMDRGAFDRAGTLLARCLWSAAVTGKLFELGWALPDGPARVAFFSRHFQHTKPEAIRVLCAHGLDVNAPIRPNGRPVPALVHAATHRTPAFVAALLAAGANVAARAEDGCSVLHAAVRLWGKQPVASFDEGAALAGFRKIVDAALVHGANLDMIDDNGQSALHLAARLGYANKCAILIELGADIQIQDNKGRTPAALAQHANRPGPQLLFQAIAARQSMQGVMERLAPPQP